MRSLCLDCASFANDFDLQKTPLCYDDCKFFFKKNFQEEKIMMGCVHVAAGLFLSKKIKKIPLLFVSCLGLHFFCDFLPHWNPNLTTQAKFVICDFVLLLVAFGLWGNLSWRSFWAVLGSTLPDVIFISEWFIFGQVVSDFTNLHGEIQIFKLEPLAGILAQILFLLGFYYFLFCEEIHEEELCIKRV